MGLLLIAFITPVCHFYCLGVVDYHIVFGFIIPALRRLLIRTVVLCVLWEARDDGAIEYVIPDEILWVCGVFRHVVSEL